MSKDRATNEQKAHAVVREAVRSTEVVLYDSSGNVISVDDFGPIAKARSEIYDIVDEQLAKLPPGVLSDVEKLVASVKDALTYSKKGRFEFNVTTGELEILLLSGEGSDIKCSVPLYKLFTALASVALLRLAEWRPDLKTIEKPSVPEYEFRNGAKDPVASQAYAAYKRGLTLLASKKFPFARKEFDRAMELQPSNPLYLQAAGDLEYRLGEYETARKLHLQALVLREETLGPAHKDTADSLASLADDLVNQGRFQEAEQFDRRALAVRQAILGSEHPKTAQSLGSLARDRMMQGNLEESFELADKALVIRETVLGGEHPETAQSLRQLAWLLYWTGKHDQAEQLARRSLRIREQALGDHEDTADSADLLGSIYTSLGRYQDAQSLHRRALATRVDVLGAEHPLAAQSLQTLAADSLQLGQFAEAEQLAERAMAIRQKVFGYEHPEVAESLVMLAVCCYQTGRLGEAERLYQKAFAICKHVLGPEHWRTMDINARLTDTRRRRLQSEGKQTWPPMWPP